MSTSESGHWDRAGESIIHLKTLYSPFFCFCLFSPLFCISVCSPPFTRHCFSHSHTPNNLFPLSLSICNPSLSDLHVEGLFRVPGHSLRQAALREMLNAGTEIDLETGDFHPNDAATLLKAFLGELPEPLLTHRHYHAYLKIAGNIHNKPYNLNIHEYTPSPCP